MRGLGVFVGPRSDGKTPMETPFSRRYKTPKPTPYTDQ